MIENALNIVKQETKPETKPVKTHKTQTNALHFSTEQIFRSERYKSRRDALSVLLDGKRKYSAAEIDNILDEFMKGKVN